MEEVYKVVPGEWPGSWRVLDTHTGEYDTASIRLSDAQRIARTGNVMYETLRLTEESRWKKGDTIRDSLILNLYRGR